MTSLPATAAAFLIALSVDVAALAQAAAIDIAPSPGPEWTCGLTNDDLPWLAREGMRKPLAAGCRNPAGAVAVAIFSDQSRLKSAMTAEQMAADAEDQLPPEWRIKSKLFDVRGIAGGKRTASFSRLVGSGDGATFLSGNAPTVAVSMNEPILWADERGEPHQVIVVFRFRAPLPKEAAKRDAVITELERAAEVWAATAKVTAVDARALTAREYEAIRTLSTIATVPRPSQPNAAQNGDPISHALNAALDGSATAADLAQLAEIERDAPDTTLGALAKSLERESRRARYVRAQQEVLDRMLGATTKKADVLSRWIVAAASAGDSDAIAAAVRAARSNNIDASQLPPSVAVSLLRAEVTDKRRFALADADRAFFLASASELLQTVRPIAPVDTIDSYATQSRGGWRLRRGVTLPAKGRLVANGPALSLLTVSGGNVTLREVTNVFEAADLAAQ